MSRLIQKGLCAVMVVLLVGCGSPTTHEGFVDDPNALLTVWEQCQKEQQAGETPSAVCRTAERSFRVLAMLTFEYNRSPFEYGKKTIDYQTQLVTARKQLASQALDSNGRAEIETKIEFLENKINERYMVLRLKQTR